jgi:hypothetical protein
MAAVMIKVHGPPLYYDIYLSSPHWILDLPPFYSSRHILPPPASRLEISTFILWYDTSIHNPQWPMASGWYLVLLIMRLLMSSGMLLVQLLNRLIINYRFNSVTLDDDGGKR